ncbi:hypothetical protein ACGFYQ_05190 [Streptomyces sp. NPDC048258]|uniref:hypothetical protein n=1 Tax=Streptomyces sp. NPDC048258 TaxID=3365527 RepID=UPI00371E8AAC
MIDDAKAAYGLRDFPYLGRELNPVQDCQDLNLLCKVGGWRLAESLGDFVAQRAAAKKPALVVTAGGSGTGRTSFANYLIHRWATGRQDAPFAPGKLIVARGKMTDFDAEEQLWKWVLDLYPQAQDHDYEPTETLERTFEALAAQKPAAMEASLGSALRKLTGALTAGGWALAGVIEDVRQRSLLTLAEKSFHFVDSLLVATVEDTAGNFDAVLDNVEAALDWEISRVATLGKLNGIEACQVVFKRWQTCTENDPPFLEGEVENAFVGRARPIARILKLMEVLLVNKVSNGPGVRWPDESLKFREGDMVKQIKYLEEILLTGR